MKSAGTVFVLLSLCFPLFVNAATAPSSSAVSRKDRAALPITVRSNDMNADNKAKIAVFTGKVVAKQGDVTIYSDKLVIKYADQTGDVEKVEAFGSVRIVQLNRTGFGEEAVYENQSGRITLTGSPRVVQGEDSVSGKIITYYLDEEKSAVTSGGDPKSRVEAVINSATRKKNAAKP